MSAPRKVLLFGGGKESLLSLHLIRSKDCYSNLYLLHFNYGQKSYMKEQEAGHYYASLYDCNYVTRDASLILPESNDETKNHIPARNAVLVSLAVNFCIMNDCTELICPFTTNNDNTDSTHTYLNKIVPLFKRLYPSLSIYSNITCKSWQTHLHLLKKKIDISRVWSCETSNKHHCGKCYKCRDFVNNVANNKQYIKILRYEKTT